MAGIAVAVLIALGILANLAQSRLERSLTELTNTSDDIYTHITGELSGMTADLTEDVTCGTRTITVATTCGQGHDENGNPVPPNESFPDCVARHNARVQEVRDTCER